MKYKILIITLIITMVSCSDWLKVDNNQQKEVSEFFKSETGFKGALTGIYMKMIRNNVYGFDLSMGFMEMLAQHWTPKILDSYNQYVTDFAYSNGLVENTINNTYLQLYNIIAEANSILKYIDERRSVFGVEKTADLIKAEALGIRAWCHFDLLRIWGPIPINTDGSKVLPYVTEFTREQTPYSTFDAFVEAIIKDLDESENLLKEIDPIRFNDLATCYDLSSVVGEGFVDIFWKYRQSRINYYNVCGLKARVYLWKGDKVNALENARKVINGTYTGNYKSYTLAQVKDFESGMDPTLSKEHMFALEVYDLDDISKTRFMSSGDGNLQKDVTQINSFYENADLRKQKLWGNVDITHGSSSFTVFTLLKYFQNDKMTTIAANKIPMMRYSEMYLIAVECGDPEASQLYNEFCITRGLSGNRDLNSMEEIMLEQYAKEFYGEGQMFFTYKRFGKSVMRWRSETFTDLNAIYVLPLPKREVVQ